MRRHAILAVTCTALLTGCGGDGDSKPGGRPAPATSAIRIADFLFAPDPATVRAGRRIAISNADRSPHTLTEEGGSPSFDSGTIRGGERGSITFATAGTFTYYCQFHATMKGTVTVVE
jgi:plastocyanin